MKFIRGRVGLVVALSVLVLIAVPAAAVTKKQANAIWKKLQMVLWFDPPQVESDMAKVVGVARAELKAEIDSLRGELESLRAQAVTAQALNQVDARVLALELWRPGVPTTSAVQSMIASDVNPLKGRLTAAEGELGGLKTLLDSVTLEDGGKTVRFTGVNLQVVSGVGSTNGTPHGCGNIIVGYNEPRNGGNERNGSHFVVVGSQNNYSTYGGLVVGLDNAVGAPYASVSGGTGNAANGYYSSVSGGMENEASNTGASVTGGDYNRALGYCAAVLGGFRNAAGNSTSGMSATIAGGADNAVTANYATVGGGKKRKASSMYNWVAGSLSQAE